MKTEKFFRCGEKLKDRAYHYQVSGLEGIYLLNGYTIKTKGGEEFISVTDVDGLHKQIGRHLVMNRKVLTPMEIRFLRKTMDLTQAELAEKLGNNSQSVARWEKGMCEIPAPADRLLRAVFIASSLSDEELEHLRLMLTTKLDEINTKDEVKISTASFEHKETWHETRELVAA